MATIMMPASVESATELPWRVSLDCARIASAPWGIGFRAGARMLAAGVGLTAALSRAGSVEEAMAARRQWLKMWFEVCAEGLWELDSALFTLANEAAIDTARALELEAPMPGAV